MEEFAPGWYPDPHDDALLRYWNGTAWTSDTSKPRVAKASKAPKVATPATANVSAAYAAPAPDPRVAAKAARLEATAAARADRDRQTTEKKAIQKAAAEEKQAALVAAQQQQEARRQEQQEKADAERRRYWAGTTFKGVAMSAAAEKVIRDHSLGDDAPWFVLTSFGAGAMAAFDDRLMIIKTGAWVSFMAGSLGAGRITTFPYTEITTIEFNGQLVSGVLEILTPSYQGSANKDFWRGASKSRNADANDPFTLSNTLPLGRAEYQAALPELNELRSRITKSKSTRFTVETAAAAPSMADELLKLSELHKAGLLTEEEYADAKKGIIGRS